MNLDPINPYNVIKNLTEQNEQLARENELLHEENKKLKEELADE